MIYNAIDHSDYVLKIPAFEGGPLVTVGPCYSFNDETKEAVLYVLNGKSVLVSQGKVVKATIVLPDAVIVKKEQTTH